MTSITSCLLLLHLPTTSFLCFTQRCIHLFFSDVDPTIYNFDFLHSSHRSEPKQPCFSLFLILVPLILGLHLSGEVPADSPATPTRPVLQITINPTFISLMLAPGEAVQTLEGIDRGSVTYLSASSVS